MLTKPAIVQEQRQSEFVCSACGAARDCECNAPALERLAAKDEGNRQRQRAYRERKTALRNAPVEKTDEPQAVTVDAKVLPAEVEEERDIVVKVLGGRTIVTEPPKEVEVVGGIRVIEMPPYELVRNGKPVSHVPATPADYEIVRLSRKTHYLDVAHRSRDAAKWDLNGLECTKEMLEAVDAVISAWTKLRRDLTDAGATYRTVSDDIDVAKA